MRHAKSLRNQLMAMAKKANGKQPPSKKKLAKKANKTTIQTYKRVKMRAWKAARPSEAKCKDKIPVTGFTVDGHCRKKPSGSRKKSTAVVYTAKSRSQSSPVSRSPSVDRGDPGEYDVGPSAPAARGGSKKKRKQKRKKPVKGIPGLAWRGAKPSTAADKKAAAYLQKFLKR